MNKKTGLLLTLVGCLGIASAAVIGTKGMQNAFSTKATSGAAYTLTLSKENVLLGKDYRYVLTSSGNEVRFLPSDRSTSECLDKLPGNGCTFFVESPISHIDSITVNYTLNEAFTPALTIYLTKNPRSITVSEVAHFDNVENGVAYTTDGIDDVDNAYIAIRHNSGSSSKVVAIESIVITYTC